MLRVKIFLYIVFLISSIFFLNLVYADVRIVRGEIMTVIGHTYTKENQRHMSVLTCIHIKSSEGKNVAAFSPAEYNENYSFFKLKKMRTKFKTEKIIIYGQQITPKNLKKSKCSESEYQIYIEEGYDLILMEKVIVGDKELVFY